jgi:hypothetical protein
MPFKIFRASEHKLPLLEDEINHFEQEIYSKEMIIDNITSSVTYEGRLIFTVHYGNKPALSN